MIYGRDFEGWIVVENDNRERDVMYSDSREIGIIEEEITEGGIMGRGTDICSMFSSFPLPLQDDPPPPPSLPESPNDPTPLPPSSEDRRRAGFCIFVFQVVCDMCNNL
jgi:hypothetical protein